MLLASFLTEISVLLATLHVPAVSQLPPLAHPAPLRRELCLSGHPALVLQALFSISRQQHVKAVILVVSLALCLQSAANLVILLFFGRGTRLLSPARVTLAISIVEQLYVSCVLCLA